MSREKGSFAPLLLLLMAPWWVGLILGLLFPFLVAFGLPILLIGYWIKQAIHYLLFKYRSRILIT